LRSGLRRWSGLRWLACVALLAVVAVCVGPGALAQQATLVGDAHVSSTQPTVNAGSLSNLNVGGGYTALVQFDLGVVPVGTTAAQIARATLRVFCNRADTPGVVAVQSVGGSWTESTVTYATLPALGVTVQTAQVGTVGAFVTFDVTSTVQGWVSSPGSNNGLALTAVAAVVQFDSKENDETSHAPQLEIALAAGSGTGGVAGAIGATGAAGPAGATGAQGIQGPMGLTGLTGATGATGAEGPAGVSGSFAYQGTYSSTVNYAAGEVVGWQGSSYVSLAATNHGNTPGLSPAEWGLLSAAGATGATGTAGAVGATGAQGPVGFGVQGATGAAGPAGATGSTGTPGLVYQGAYSSTTNYGLGDVVVWSGSSYASLVASNHGQTPGLNPGSWGILTAQGPVGATGAAGPMGGTGATGALGPVGPPGEQGNTGAQGGAGQAGAQGIPGVAGATGLQGPAGPQGVAGPVGLSFIGAYSSTVNYALGNGVMWQGAGYVSLIASNQGNTPSLSPSAWAMFAASGAAGAAGAAGAQGANGLSGATGAAGATGATGAAGTNGTNGAPGLVWHGGWASGTNYAANDAVSYAGTAYLSLVAGNLGQNPALSPSYWAVLAAAGAAGANGATGAAGATGVQGTAGAPGATGATGARGIAGAVGMNFRGAWTSGTNYAVNDAVTFAGSTYLALTAGSNAEPDTSAQAWAVLAQAGGAGPTGAQGDAATVAIGTVSTLAAGAQATVTNSGTGGAVVLNFGIPQGAAGTGGSGGGSGGGGLAGGLANLAGMYHTVSFNTLYYAVNSPNASASETASVLAWVPAGCTATQLSVYSQQSATIKVTLRMGTAAAMASTALACSVATNESCTSTGSVTIAAGEFMDITIASASGTPAGVWTAVTCQ
jgi:hypothetical protein